MIQIFNLYIYKYRMLLIYTLIYKYKYVCVCVFYISNPTNAIQIVPFFLSQVAKVIFK